MLTNLEGRVIKPVTSSPVARTYHQWRDGAYFDVVRTCTSLLYIHTGADRDALIATELMEFKAKLNKWVGDNKDVHNVQVRKHSAWQALSHIGT